MHAGCAKPLNLAIPLTDLRCYRTFINVQFFARFPKRKINSVYLESGRAVFNSLTDIVLAFYLYWIFL